jgi:hypothetical protein
VYVVPVAMICGAGKKHVEYRICFFSQNFVSAVVGESRYIDPLLFYQYLWTTVTIQSILCLLCQLSTMSSNPSSSSSTGDVSTAAGDDDDLLRSTNMTIQLAIPGAPGAPRVPFLLSTTTTTVESSSSSDDGGNTGTTTTSISSTEFRRQVSVATHIPISKLYLIYRGRHIVDNDKNDVAVDFKLEEGSVLQCYPSYFYTRNLEGPLQSPPNCRIF